MAASDIEAKHMMMHATITTWTIFVPIMFSLEMPKLRYIYSFIKQKVESLFYRGILINKYIN